MPCKRFLCIGPVLALIFVALFSCNTFAATTTADVADSSLFELQLDHGTFLDQNAPAAGAWQKQLYAMNSTDATVSSARSSKKTRGFNLGTTHKYLGYGTVLAAVTTAATGGDNSVHKGAAYVTAAAALSTVLTGYLAHGDRLDLSEGIFSKDNLHIVLGALGAAILTTAVAIADNGKEGSHSSLGVAGGTLMTLAVIDIKF